jgi:F-type H+-transporting ATPase subunit a
MNIFAALEHSTHFPWVISSTIFASTLLVLAGLTVKRAIANGGGVLPEEGVSLRNVFEVLIEFLVDLAHTAMRDDEAPRKYFPLIGTIFLFILVSNLMGLVPGLAGSTSDVNTTFAWACISFLTYNVVGIKTHGWKYIYQFMGPSIMNLELGGKHYHVRLLAPIFFPLEIILHFARIVTLAVRLLANMFADHMVVIVWLGLVPLVVPAIFMGLGMLVCFLQAFVFALLTMIYIGDALQEAH